MNTSVGRPQIGQWYAPAGKGEVFHVVGHDESARTIEIQSFDGDVDEIDDDQWRSLLLERSAPPEDWTGPMDDVETDDLGYSETEMKPADWAQPLQSLQVAGEVWEDTWPEEDREALGEGSPGEPFSADEAEASEST